MKGLDHADEPPSLIWVKRWAGTVAAGVCLRPSEVGSACRRLGLSLGMMGAWVHGCLGGVSVFRWGFRVHGWMSWSFSGTEVWMGGCLDLYLGIKGGWVGVSVFLWE